MNALREILRRNRGLALMVLAAALLARVAMPQGWMPDAGSDTITVRLCTAAGVVHVPLPGQPDTPTKPDREQPSCAFAGLVLAAPPPGPGADLPLPPLAAEQFGRASAPFVLAQAARQMPPARGPPSRA
ncbi:hypothetical protein [Tsuneonella sp. HG222]